MIRLALLASAAALAVPAARAAQPVAGEGATSVIAAFNAEFAKDQTIDTGFVLRAYPTASNKGKTAFIANAGTAGSGVPSGVPVDFVLSDASVTAAELATWNANDAPVAGPLIQIPVVGVPVVIPFTEPGVSTNGGLKLTDPDLRGIFSGKLKTFADLSQPAPSSVPFQVVYRADAAGTTFILTEHLAKVCTTANSNFTAADIAKMPVSLFTDISTTAGLVNPIAAQGINGEATAVAQASAAIGWVSPDHTSIASTPAAGYDVLRVASVRSPNGTYYLPTYTNTSTALSGAQKNATDLNAPTGAAAADPTKWFPQTPQPQRGYPIVGYTTWAFATCYQAGKDAALHDFLVRHLQTNGPYKSTVTGYGYLPVTDASYVTAIRSVILADNGQHLNIGNATVCAPARRDARETATA